MHVGEDPRPVRSEGTSGVVEVRADAAHARLDGEVGDGMEPHEVRDEQPEDGAGEHQADPGVQQRLGEVPDYDAEGSFEDYLEMLQRVMAEVHRVLEPGGRAAVNVANLGRRPYLPLSHRMGAIMDDLGLHMRGEIIWRKARAPRAAVRSAPG